MHAHAHMRVYACFSLMASCAKGREYVEFSGPSGSPSEVPTGDYDPWTLGRVYGSYQRWGGTCVNCQEKWDKGKGIIRDLMRWTKQSRWLDHKELKRGRGFLIYLSRTYPPMTPFLLGRHQTIDGWRSCRHEDGWKMQHAEIMAAKGDDDMAEVAEDNPGKNDPPRLVKAAAL
jgi:hypothetical protein